MLVFVARYGVAGCESGAVLQDARGAPARFHSLDDAVRDVS